MSGKTKIVEPMKNIHGTLRDSDAIEREVALVMREIIEQGIFKTSLKPIQPASSLLRFMRERTTPRSPVNSAMRNSIRRLPGTRQAQSFRELDFRMPFDKAKMEELITSGKTMKEVSDELGVSPSTMREYREMIEEQETRPSIRISVGSGT